MNIITIKPAKGMQGNLKMWPLCAVALYSQVKMLKLYAFYILNNILTDRRANILHQLLMKLILKLRIIR
jgi:hypothetical protein